MENGLCVMILPNLRLMYIFWAHLKWAGLNYEVQGVESRSNNLSILFLTWKQSGTLFFFFFLGPYLQCTEVPRLGVKLELQLPAYTTATATPDPSRACDLHHSSWQRWILNPHWARPGSQLNLMVPSRIQCRCATTGTPFSPFLGWMIK